VTELDTLDNSDAQHVQYRLTGTAVDPKDAKAGAVTGQVRQALAAMVTESEIKRPDLPRSAPGLGVGLGVRSRLLVQYLVPLVMRRASVSITASEARKNLFPLIEQVNDDRSPIEITSRRGDAVLLSKADYDALQETAHLLRVPANAKRLLESLQQAQDGQRETHELSR
jgi:antitoxin YefM